LGHRLPTFHPPPPVYSQLDEPSPFPSVCCESDSRINLSLSRGEVAEIVHASDLSMIEFFRRCDFVFHAFSFFYYPLVSFLMLQSPVTCHMFPLTSYFFLPPLQTRFRSARRPSTPFVSHEDNARSVLCPFAYYTLPLFAFSSLIRTPHHPIPHP